MYNDQGGVEIGGEKYKIEIVSIDDKNDPKLAASGAERLVHQEGIKYIIGPNVDITAASIVPVVEAGGAMSFPYSFTRALYSPPHENMVLGMIASLSGRADHLQVSDGKQGREVDRLHRPQRLRRAQSARRRRGGGQGSRARDHLLGGHLRARHHRLLPGGLEGGEREPGPDRALGRGACGRAAADPDRARARLSRASSPPRPPRTSTS